LSQSSATEKNTQGAPTVECQENGANGRLIEAGPDRSEAELFRRARLAIVLASLTATAPLLLFSLALVERKWKVLLNRGPFLLEHPLQWWGKIPFVFFFTVAILLLIVTASTALWLVIRSLLGSKACWTAKYIVLAVALGYFVAITVQYRVAQYFRDGLSMALLRGLGGGSWLTSLHYVQEEFAGLLPLIAASLVVMLLGGWLVRRNSGRLAAWMVRRWPVQVLASTRGLLAANAIMIVCPWLLFTFAFPLHEDLGFGIAYQVYSLPTSPLTGFNARDIRSGMNTSDGADPAPKVYWWEHYTPWDASQLEHKNVLLVVLETGRHDLLDAKVDGVPVMPVLSSLPGYQLLMFSQSGYTVPSLNAIFNGTLDGREKSISLVDRFNDMGYQTAVFSAQYEGFGNTSTTTHMNRADVYVDAGSFPREKRMYANAAASALSIPAPLVTQRFGQWLNGMDHQRPFFVYMNLQEMHFPYYYWGEPTPLVNPPIPRDKIVRSNRDWLIRTYWNAARNVDTELGHVIDDLKRAGVLSNTVIMIVGDHGEELFDHGNLGHGMSVSFEQYSTIAKLINSNWKPPSQAFGQSSVSTLIHNALVRKPEYAWPVDEDFFCYAGDAIRPGQLGEITSKGLIRFDFRRKRWDRQPAPEEEFVPSKNYPPLADLWELYLRQLPSADGRTQKSSPQ
jgi:phosphoglycerol transferase MdoB-like AlkP superfamily enzyme